MPEDISGLPVYYVNKRISKKLEDGSIMTTCGVMIEGHFNGLYVVMSPASTGMHDAQQFIAAASERPAGAKLPVVICAERGGPCH
jgi:hypothetical protein